MSKKQPDLPVNEWSHYVDADEIDDRPFKVTISPSAEQCEDLARRLEVETVNDIKADLTLSREQGGLVVHVTGKLTANLTQICVVSLDPFENIIEEQVEGWFASKDQAVSFAGAKKEQQVKKSQAEVKILEESEDPEPIIGGKIDLGELVTQHLSLAINPYPHKEGVKYELGDEDEGSRKASSLRKNPFEALKDWKERR